MWNRIAKVLVRIALWAASHPQIIEDVIQGVKDAKRV